MSETSISKQTENSLRRTPLYEEHLTAKAKMVEFAGWQMPVQYKGVKDEHLAVRKDVGLFDVSHMGEARVRGPNSLATLEWLTSNSVSRLKAGQAQYSLLPNEQGGLVDDIIVYCLTPGEDYLVCLNAANTKKDLDWMKANNRGADISDESSKWAQIAVQGPKAKALLARIFGPEVAQLKSFHCQWFEALGGRHLLAATGYTGEAGAEIFVPSELAPKVWKELLKQGQDLGVQAIGLAARDTLRTEMKYSLYGHEINDSSNPYAAGLGWVVKPDAKDFIGKAAILQGKAKGFDRVLVGLKPTERGIPREGYGVEDVGGNAIGHVTSGTHSPSLDGGIAIAYVPPQMSSIGTKLMINIRGRKLPALVCETPFVKPGV